LFYNASRVFIDYQQRKYIFNKTLWEKSAISARAVLKKPAETHSIPPIKYKVWGILVVLPMEIKSIFKAPYTPTPFLFYFGWNASMPLKTDFRED
jgi:hypothetical protein